MKNKSFEGFVRGIFTLNGSTKGFSSTYCTYLSMGNDTYGITGIPSTVGGCGVVQRAGLVASTRIVYPGSGRKDA